MIDPDRQPQDAQSTFEQQAEERSSSLLAELAAFLRENRKWWLIPVIASLLLLGLLVFLGGTAVAPFIYTLW